MLRVHEATPVRGQSEKGKEWEVRVSQSKLREVSSLSDRAFRLLICIEAYARASDVCWPSNDQLAGDSGKSRRSVQEGLVELAKAGYVVRECDGNGRPLLRMLRRISDNGLESTHCTNKQDAEIRTPCGNPHPNKSQGLNSREKEKKAKTSRCKSKAQEAMHRLAMTRDSSRLYDDDGFDLLARD